MVISLLLQSLPDLDRHEQFQKFSFPTTLWLTWSMPSSVCHFTRSTPFERPVGFEGTLKQFMTSFFDRVYVAIYLSSLSAMIVNIFLAISYDLKYSVWKSIRKALLLMPTVCKPRNTTQARPLTSKRTLSKKNEGKRSRVFHEKTIFDRPCWKICRVFTDLFNCNAHFNEKRRNILHEPSECEG